MGTAYNPKIVTDGLVLCLDAANAKSYPGTGTTWTDLSGNGNNGTLTNGPTYSSSNNGSIEFDGSNDYISSSITQSSNITICFWVRKTSFNTSNPAFFTISPASVTVPASQGSTDKVLGGWVSNANGRIWGRVIDTTSTKNLPTNSEFTLTLNEWTYISYVLDDVLYSTYKNSVAGVSVAYSGTVANYQNVFIGAQGSEYHAGNISSFKIYNRALTVSEIRQNFNATRGRYGI